MHINYHHAGRTRITISYVRSETRALKNEDPTLFRLNTHRWTMQCRFLERIMYMRVASSARGLIYDLGATGDGRVGVIVS